MPRRIRVIVGKPGLDGHDRGAKVVASALRDAGMEVIYTGLRATPEAIVQAAIQESCNVIGLSVLSGAHLAIGQKVLALLHEKGVNIPVLVGGVIPDEDRAALQKMGIQAVLGQEATLEEIVTAVKRLAGQEQEVSA